MTYRIITGSKEYVEREVQEALLNGSHLYGNLVVTHHDSPTPEAKMEFVYSQVVTYRNMN